MPNVRDALAMALATVVAVEVGTRLDDWIRFGTPFLAEAVSLNDLLIRDSTGMHARPSQHFRKWRTNRVGTRGPEPKHLDRPSAPRVIVSGASETFGLLESPNQEWPAQLQTRLDSACGAERPDVLNAAFAGMSLPTVRQDLDRRLSALGAQWFVYYTTPAQYLETDVPTPATPSTTRPSGRLPGALRLRFPQRVRDQIRASLPEFVLTWNRQRDIARATEGQPATWFFESPPPDRLALFEADLRKLVGSARTLGMRVVLVQHAAYLDVSLPPSPRDSLYLPMWQRYYPRARPSALIANEAAAVPIVARVAADSGALLVDPRAMLHADRDRFFGDQSHFTDAGAAVVAGLVAEAMLRAGVCRDTTAAPAGG